MTEQKLKEYFENKISCTEFCNDLKGSQVKTSFDVTNVLITQIEDGEFEIKLEHLIKLSNDVINGNLTTEDINTIAFALNFSDFFIWDENTVDGKIISDVVFDWDNPNIGYDLNIENFKKWKEYLETGNNNFDKEELKKKFRGKKRTNE